MKRTFILFFAFISCLACIDFLLGYILKPILISEPDASNNHSNFKQSLFNKSGDILILGASRANHHYNSSIISQHFNMIVYNAGVDGDNIITTRVQFESMLSRKTPQLVLLDISAGQLKGQWESMLLSHKCYYGSNKYYTQVVNDIFSLYDKIFLLSNMYRFNEAIPDILFSYIIGNKGCDGYMPMIGSAPNLSSIVKDEPPVYKIGAIQKKIWI